MQTEEGTKFKRVPGAVWRGSHCLWPATLPLGHFLHLQRVTGFHSLHLPAEGSRGQMCSALLLQTSNPNIGISHNILAVGLCRHAGSGMVLGIIIPLDSDVHPALLSCRKQNLQETEWGLRELGLIVRMRWGERRQSCFSPHITRLMELDLFCFVLFFNSRYNSSFGFPIAIIINLTFSFSLIFFTVPVFASFHS